MIDEFFWCRLTTRASKTLVLFFSTFSIFALGRNYFVRLEGGLLKRLKLEQFE